MAAIVSGLAVTQSSRQLASILRTDPIAELAACAPTDERYAELFFRNMPFNEWPDEYHKLVNEVIEEYSRPPETIACQSEVLLPADTDSSMYRLAGQLPPWNSEEELADLTRADVGFVLLEFLRIYECALKDRENFIYVYVESDHRRQQSHVQTYEERNVIARSEQALLETELKTARPTLEKALQVVTGHNRLSQLDAELQCLQRASLDVRNAFSLAADTSSCLPRVWNAKDVLRNLSD